MSDERALEHRVRNVLVRAVSPFAFPLDPDAERVAMQAFVRERPDDVLLALNAIGPKTLAALRAWAGPYALAFAVPEDLIARRAPVPAFPGRPRPEASVEIASSPIGDEAWATIVAGIEPVPWPSDPAWTPAAVPTGAVCTCGGAMLLEYREHPIHADGSEHARHAARSYRLRCAACGRVSED